ncbi:MAG: 30S ribosomal protein S17 [bacterium]|jgi:small subunit ribosomal protein S17|nr:30S ribosomal protein S17 [Planctomycetota bacterium]HIL51333.1 30S ribosomal protein S17 [Planctomycetota bacterium]
MEAKAQATETARNSRRSAQGTVTSAGMNKSIGVRVERVVKHPKYNKYIRRHSKFIVHDEENAANVGDIVDIAECRPLSKTKRWRLLSVVKTAVDDGGAL